MEEKYSQTTRSVIVLGITVFLIGLSAIVPAKWLGVKPLQQNHLSLDLENIASPKEVAQDTNKDGVISWGEVVDATLKSSTTSLDKIKKIPVDKKTIAELNDPNNLTASYSKNLYLTTSYLNEKNITAESAKKEAVSYLIQQEAEKVKATKYTIGDLRVAKSESKESIKTYGNTIYPLMREVINKKLLASDIASLQMFAETRDAKYLTIFAHNVPDAEALLKKLLKVEVPPSAVPYHIAILNVFSAYKTTILNFSRADTDPVRGSIATDGYSELMKAIIVLPKQLSGYFTAQNVVFSEKDAGYQFTIGYTY